jgi:hypothetical protein
MRAHTTIISRRRRKARRRRAVALALGICALAIPASASADPSTYQDYSMNATTPPESEPSQPGGGSGGSPDVSSGYAAHTTGIGSSSGEPTVVSASPAKTPEGFDWASAAVGAGAAMALVALGGAALLTVRRRTAISPSASAS